MRDPEGREVAGPALRSGNLVTRLPRLLAREPEELDAYWERLGRAGLRHPYGAVHPRHGQVESQYGTALDISSDLAAHLVGAVRAVDALVKRYVRRASGLTPWLDDRAPTFGGVPLNFEAVNRPLDRLLLAEDPERRSLLPIALDAMVTVGADGAPTLSVIELQTGLGYAKILWQQLEALGYDPGAATCWSGSVSPHQALAEVRRTLAGGEDVSVLANFPSLGHNLPDEAGWAGLFSGSGLPTGFFLPSDLQRDAEGWYHLEYEIDPSTGLPSLDADDRPIRRRPPRARRIRHVVTMQLQGDLDAIGARLSLAERARLLDFLRDGETVSWVVPHSAWYIADKSLMGRLRADLLLSGSPYADLFVPCHGPGERVDAAGDYVLKPIRGVGGRGVRDVTVGSTPFVVPEGDVAQRRFTPFPFPVRLPSALASAFPVPEGRPGWDAHREDPRSTTASIELRVFSLPGSTERADSYVFMARVAPTWDPEALTPVLTNLSRIQSALWSSPRVDRTNFKYAPFGWFVVTVDAGGAPSGALG